jgi:hypothetical protein
LNVFALVDRFESEPHSVRVVVLERAALLIRYAAK